MVPLLRWVNIGYVCIPDRFRKLHGSQQFSARSATVAKKMDQLQVPVSRPLQLNLNELEYSSPTGKPIYLEHSPGLSQKIKIPKKRYSYADPLERMDTPMFDKNPYLLLSIFLTEKA
ncbi:hypothetical protein ANCDUO_07332 [Ancylostoma duodenale]|uniref:Uncharacterized protein n=1 Tax=Ancylostoma duodenale TaxID=51022 RepID=A0A0C2GME6_9BILA|nr:hypothetical protein ANCDUO_07332 [Ancylostoma duodenale]